MMKKGGKEEGKRIDIHSSNVSAMVAPIDV